MKCLMLGCMGQGYRGREPFCLRCYARLPVAMRRSTGPRVRTTKTLVDAIISSVSPASNWSVSPEKTSEYVTRAVEEWGRLSGRGEIDK